MEKEKIIDEEKKNIFKRLFDKFIGYVKEAPKSYKIAFDILLVLSIFVVLGFSVYPMLYNTFYNCNSDDIVQYYPYVAGFFEKLKSGTFSIYDTTLFGGASIFASTYYIPIDIFLFIAFLLSFIMTAYRAYFISLLLKIVCGGLLMFYVMKKHNIRPLVCTMISVIYMVTGLTQTYFIFPVYLGIIFYAPVAMLLTDLFFDKKKKYLSCFLIPPFVIVIVLFDFYCAYMLLAFMSIYFLLISHINSEKFFFVATKKFWKNFVEFFAVILVGVMLSCAILLPSAFYILNESSRSSDSADYFWYYSSNHYTASGISWRHYFTQLINFFIPNNPHYLCLVSAGDYVREHGSLYMTSGLLIYLFRFLFMKGKRENRVRFWVILLNLMYLMPIFAMIFTFSKSGYLRWLFIPYIFNMIAAALAMDKYNFSLNINKDKLEPKNFRIKLEGILPILGIILGLFLTIYTFNTNIDLFIHYSKGDSYFSDILIPSIIFLVLYLLVVLILNVLDFCKINTEVLYHLMPLVILGELVVSVVIIVSGLGSTSYPSEYNTSNNQVSYLKKAVNYDYSQGYRINLYTENRYITNNNSMFLNVNCTNFFQSFYNTALNSYYNNVDGISNTSWSRHNMYGYSLLNCEMYNNKYIITGNTSYTSDLLLTNQKVISHTLTLPSKYFTEYYNTVEEYNEETGSYETKIVNKYNAKYYALNSLPQFIVYDDVFYTKNESSIYSDTFMNDLALLKYGYATLGQNVYSKFDDGSIETLMSNYDSVMNQLTSKDDKNELKSLKKLYEAGLLTKTRKEVFNELNKEGSFSSVDLSSKSYNAISKYYTYDLSNVSGISSVLNRDAIYVYPYDSDVAQGEFDKQRYSMYFSDSTYTTSTEGNNEVSRLNMYPFHYNVCYLSELDINPDTFYMRVGSLADSSYLTMYGFDYSIYDDFLSRQNEYENRSFSINGSRIHVAFKNTNANAKVIKTAYAYSDDWKVMSNNINYDTVSVDGGFLGIIVPSGVENVDVTINYCPYGLSTGLKISAVGGILYVTIVTIGMMYESKKRKEELVWKLYQ